MAACSGAERSSVAKLCPTVGLVLVGCLLAVREAASWAARAVVATNPVDVDGQSKRTTTSSSSPRTHADGTCDISSRLARPGRLSTSIRTGSKQAASTASTSLATRTFCSNEVDSGLHDAMNTATTGLRLAADAVLAAARSACHGVSADAATEESATISTPIEQVVAVRHAPAHRSVVVAPPMALAPYSRIRSRRRPWLRPPLPGGLGGLPIGKTLRVVSVDPDAGIASKSPAAARTRKQGSSRASQAPQPSGAETPQNPYFFGFFAASRRVSSRSPCLTDRLPPRILRSVVVTDDSGTSFKPSGGFVAGLRLNSLWDGSRPGSQDSARGLPIGVFKSPGSRGRGLVSDAVVTTASFSRVFSGFPWETRAGFGRRRLRPCLSGQVEPDGVHAFRVTSISRRF